MYNPFKRSSKYTLGQQMESLGFSVETYHVVKFGKVKISIPESYDNLDVTCEWLSRLSFDPNLDRSEKVAMQQGYQVLLKRLKELSSEVKP